MAAQQRRGRSLLLATLSLCFLYWLFVHKGSRSAPTVQPRPARHKELIVAATKKEVPGTGWINEYLGDWKTNLYVVDDPTATLTVPVNKGREAMVYLSFIIDNYENLPQYMVFMHSQRYQWHNDDPRYDGVPLFANIQLDHILREGYVNLRCAWDLGCPIEIRNYTPEELAANASRMLSEAAYPGSFATLFPEFEIPSVVGVSCCAQFAVTREAVLKRPKRDYHRYRKWLVETELGDDVSGRVLEYSWHIMLGKPAVHCPSAGVCYCQVFGFCDLKGCNEKGCGKQYVLPPYSTMPLSWPDKGFGGTEGPGAYKDPKNPFAAVNQNPLGAPAQQQLHDDKVNDS